MQFQLMSMKRRMASDDDTIIQYPLSDSQIKEVSDEIFKKDEICYNNIIVKLQNHIVLSLNGLLPELLNEHVYYNNDCKRNNVKEITIIIDQCTLQNLFNTNECDYSSSIKKLLYFMNIKKLNKFYKQFSSNICFTDIDYINLEIHIHIEYLVNS